MRRVLFWLVVAIVVSLTSIQALQRSGQSTAGSRTKLIGMWRLTSFESADGVAGRGAHPIGLLVYDPSGSMSVQIMPDRKRRPFSGTGSPSGAHPTADEALDAVTDYTAYFGTYTIDECANTVTHHPQGGLNSGAIGRSIPRQYRLSDADHLSLSAPDNSVAKWERAK